ncbi:hypothetical protein GWK47_007275 [Chionoecetes opilio]|uniref:Uncharacterized protein n=1 Tax=Chionoecetes opilio TaxID=41210 RepID=A0A8J5CSU0_CHIOP|nr:hypothetical protein GWK47_007275 [Chionoecetes opilio]
MRRRDVRGALRLLTTPDTVAPPNAETVAELRTKHPPAPPGEDLAKLYIDQPTTTPLDITVEDVMAAIQSMPPGSSAGLDGIRPLHLASLPQKKRGSRRAPTHGLDRPVQSRHLGPHPRPRQKRILRRQPHSDPHETRRTEANRHRQFLPAPGQQTSSEAHDNGAGQSAARPLS